MDGCREGCLSVRDRYSREGKGMPRMEGRGEKGLCVWDDGGEKKGMSSQMHEPVAIYIGLITDLHPQS